MAWIEQQRRADGGLTARVIWRPGGARGATRVWETFGAGSDAQNLARADGFKRMVEAAGQRWPDGWVKGEGFVRPPDVADPMTPPPSFDKIGEEYVRQIVDLSPGQRKRYLGQLQLLARTPVRGSLVFAGPVTAIGEAQLKTWLIEWDRSLKTKANYHGLIYGVFAYAVKRGYWPAVAQRRLLHPRMAEADDGGGGGTYSAIPVSRSAAHPRGVVDRRRCSAPAHPGQAWPRVDHHDDRHLRSPVACWRRVDLADHRYCANRWHHPAERRSVLWSITNHCLLPDLGAR
jgi:hypothetical protein